MEINKNGVSFMVDTLFYKPHAMLAYYKVNKVPKESIKRELTSDFNESIDRKCALIEYEEEVHKKAQKIGFNIEEFEDIHSLILTIVFYCMCDEKVDYYRRKKSLEFAKAFEEIRKMPSKNAIEELKVLGITYKKGTYYKEGRALMEEFKNSNNQLYYHLKRCF